MYASSQAVEEFGPDFALDDLLLDAQLESSGPLLFGGYGGAADSKQPVLHPLLVLEAAQEACSSGPSTPHALTNMVNYPADVNAYARRRREPMTAQLPGLAATTSPFTATWTLPAQPAAARMELQANTVVYTTDISLDVFDADAGCAALAPVKPSSSSCSRAADSSAGSPPEHAGSYDASSSAITTTHMVPGSVALHRSCSDANAVARAASLPSYSSRFAAGAGAGAGAGAVQHLMHLQSMPSGIPASPCRPHEWDATTQHSLQHYAAYQMIVPTTVGSTSPSPVSTVSGMLPCAAVSMAPQPQPQLQDQADDLMKAAAAYCEEQEGADAAGTAMASATPAAAGRKAARRRGKGADTVAASCDKPMACMSEEPLNVLSERFKKRRGRTPKVVAALGPLAKLAKRAAEGKLQLDETSLTHLAQAVEVKLQSAEVEEKVRSRERNRTAQRRFRDRQKSTIQELRARCDEQHDAIEALRRELAFYEHQNQALAAQLAAASGAR